MAMRRGGFEAAPARGAAIEPHHTGLCSGFINEDKMLRVQIGLARTPLLARLGDIGAATAQLDKTEAKGRLSTWFSERIHKLFELNQ